MKKRFGRENRNFEAWMNSSEKMLSERFQRGSKFEQCLGIQSVISDFEKPMTNDHFG